MCVVTRSPWGNPAASQSLRVSARPVGETSHIATLQASATSWRTSSRPIPLPPPVTTAVLPANSVMCTSLAFWGPSDTAFAYLSTGGEARRGAMSGRQTPADLARELLEEIDIVGALGRPADQFIDLMGAEPPRRQARSCPQTPSCVLLPGARGTRCSNAHHEPGDPLGAGQAGCFAWPQTTINAILDALASLGIDHIDMRVQRTVAGARTIRSARAGRRRGG